MIRKAIDILKTRWPEATLVAGLFAGWLMLYGELISAGQVAEQNGTKMPFLANFVLGLGFMMMFTICVMLWMGFLKTLSTDSQQPQQPGFLVRRGQPYFWHTFIFMIVYELFCGFIASVIIVGIWFAWKADMSAPPEQMVEQVKQFVENTRLTEVAMLLAYAIFIKPLIFIPARIVVFDNTFMQAFLAMWRYRLREIKSICPLAAGGFSAIIAAMAASLLVPEKTAVYYILLAIYHLLLCGVILFLTLLAVVWMQAHRDAEQAPLPKESE